MTVFIITVMCIYVGVYLTQIIDNNIIIFSNFVPDLYNMNFHEVCTTSGYHNYFLGMAPFLAINIPISNDVMINYC